MVTIELQNDYKRFEKSDFKQIRNIVFRLKKTDWFNSKSKKY